MLGVVPLKLTFFSGSKMSSMVRSFCATAESENESKRIAVNRMDLGYLKMISC